MLLLLSSGDVIGCLAAGPGVVHGDEFAVAYDSLFDTGDLQQFAVERAGGVGVEVVRFAVHPLHLPRWAVHFNGLDAHIVKMAGQACLI